MLHVAHGHRAADEQVAIVDRAGVFALQRIQEQHDVAVRHEALDLGVL